MADFTCDNFSPQKWRKDVCRNCYQPLKLHSSKNAAAPSSPPVATVTRTPSGGKSQAKVFQRFQANKPPVIDKTIPPRERTAPPVPIQPGIVKKVHEIAPTLKTRDPPVIPPPLTGATPTSQGAAAPPPSPPQISPKPKAKSKASPPVPRKPVQGLPSRPKPPALPKPKSSPNVSPQLVPKENRIQEVKSTESMGESKVTVLPQEDVKETLPDPQKPTPCEENPGTTEVEPPKIEDVVTETIESTSMESVSADASPAVEPAPPVQDIVEQLKDNTTEPVMTESKEIATSNDLSEPPQEIDAKTSPVSNLNAEPAINEPVDDENTVIQEEPLADDDFVIVDKNDIPDPLPDYPPPPLVANTVECTPTPLESSTPPAQDDDPSTDPPAAIEEEDNISTNQLASVEEDNSTPDEPAAPIEQEDTLPIDTVPEESSNIELVPESTSDDISKNDTETVAKEVKSEGNYCVLCDHYYYTRHFSSRKCF